MGSSTDTRSGIGAIETGFAIVEAIRDRESPKLTEIADAVGVADSTAYEHLVTLQEAGYVIREADGYRLGLQFLDHGMLAKTHYQGLIDASESVIDQLVAETEETVNLVVEENGRAVYIYRSTGERGIPTNSWLGKQKPIHTLAAGKAILAHLSRDDVDEIVDTHGLAGTTAQTITSRSALDEELGRVRERGYSTNDRESDERIRAVGAPIVHDGRVDGALSVAGPADRLRDSYFEEELPDLLQGTVNEIELRLTYNT